jgi:hypothetical protein
MYDNIMLNVENVCSLSYSLYTMFSVMGCIPNFRWFIILEDVLPFFCFKNISHNCDWTVTRKT